MIGMKKENLLFLTEDSFLKRVKDDSLAVGGK